MGKSTSAVVIDFTKTPHPAGSSESTLATISRRAVGGKVAMVERGSKLPLIVTTSPEDPNIVSCDSVAVDGELEAEVTDV